MSLDVFSYSDQPWDFSKAGRATDAQRVAFVAVHHPSFVPIDPEHPNNRGYSYEMFTVLTQHTKGNSILDLLDAGVYAMQEGGSVLEHRFRHAKDQT